MNDVGVRTVRVNFTDNSCKLFDVIMVRFYGKWVVVGDEAYPSRVVDSLDIGNGVQVFGNKDRFFEE